MPERIPALCVLCGQGPTQGGVVVCKDEAHEHEVGRVGLCARCFGAFTRGAVRIRFEPLGPDGREDSCHLCARTPTRGGVVLLVDQVHRHEVARIRLDQRCYVGLMHGTIKIEFEPLRQGGARDVRQFGAPKDGPHLQA